MTKRFEMVITGVDGSFYYLDTVTGERIKSTLELENKLNELNNENKQLKKQLQDCRIYNGKLYANGVKKDKPIVNDLIKQRKENTRIKQTIREAYESERTQIGKNVLKQLLQQLE